MTEGILLVICGPSGVGKGTINRTLLASIDNLLNSISATTRAPRCGEVDGQDYFFITENQFQQYIEANALLEWAKVHDYFYGTPKYPVQQALAEGKDVLLEIDVQGALQIKHNYPEAVLVFLMPPSFDELERRLRNRGTENEEQIKRRLATANWELTMVNKFDYVIINTVINEACEDVKAILRAEKIKIKNYKGVFILAD